MVNILDSSSQQLNMNPNAKLLMRRQERALLVQIVNPRPRQERNLLEQIESHT
jgi:hypothetical protein